jgi:hypothetical protein
MAGHTYRDEREAALQQVDALRRENHELRRQLAATRDGGDDADPDDDAQRFAGHSGRVVAFFVWGAIVSLFAIMSSFAATQSCPRHRSPCAYRSGGSVQGFASESGMLVVHITAPDAEVRVDGITIPEDAVTPMGACRRWTTGLPAVGLVVRCDMLEANQVHLVEVAAPGFLPATRQIQVGSQFPTSVRIDLAPAASESARTMR